MKLLIVDDHILFREGLAALIKEPDISIVGLAGSVQEAVEAAQQLVPDMILMDFDLPDGTGAEATEIILKVNPKIKVIILSIYEDDKSLFAAIRSGAKGYLIKSITPAKLVAAIRSVSCGESALSRVMTLKLMEEFSKCNTSQSNSSSNLSQLTQREQEILAILPSGFSNQQIASCLFISENTVKYHMHAILEKLGVADRKSAAMKAVEYGLTGKEYSWNNLRSFSKVNPA